MNVVNTSLYMQLLNQTEDDMSQYYTFYNKKWFIVSALFQSLEFWAVRSLPICSKYQFFYNFLLNIFLFRIVCKYLTNMLIDMPH